MYWTLSPSSYTRRLYNKYITRKGTEIYTNRNKKLLSRIYISENRRIMHWYSCFFSDGFYLHMKIMTMRIAEIWIQNPDRFLPDADISVSKEIRWQSHAEKSWCFYLADLLIKKVEKYVKIFIFVVNLIDRSAYKAKGKEPVVQLWKFAGYGRKVLRITADIPEARIIKCVFYNK